MRPFACSVLALTHMNAQVVRHTHNVPLHRQQCIHINLLRAP